MITAGPAWKAAAWAPMEKMPAPTATATPIMARSHQVRSRFRERPDSPVSANVCSTDFLRNMFIMFPSPFVLTFT